MMHQCHINQTFFLVLRHRQIEILCNMMDTMWNKSLKHSQSHAFIALSCRDYFVYVPNQWETTLQCNWAHTQNDSSIMYTSTIMIFILHRAKMDNHLSHSDVLNPLVRAAYIQEMWDKACYSQICFSHYFEFFILFHGNEWQNLYVICILPRAFVQTVIHPILTKILPQGHIHCLWQNSSILMNDCCRRHCLPLVADEK